MEILKATLWGLQEEMARMAGVKLTGVAGDFYNLGQECLACYFPKGEVGEARRERVGAYCRALGVPERGWFYVPFSFQGGRFDPGPCRAESGYGWTVDGFWQAIGRCLATKKA
ncbi:MAG TPA: hypothetical protein VJG48_01860 [Candidatus Paceibacterota bacterium]